ncbi:MAG: hypothetical protein DMF63_14390 [Acidobacteria bacterium]|nr:MAG: hypothetical protein DMF63_14390 [Acidobacteriota bacterium]
MSSGKGMEGSQHREVVLEIEHIQVVRKRAKTQLAICRECKSTTDFITLPRAAELFSTSTSDLFEFTQSYGCHFRVENGQDILLCLTDLLTAMSKRMRTGTVKLLGEKL